MLGFNLVIFCFLLLFVNCSEKRKDLAPIPSLENEVKDYLVGINYFAGWWVPHPNKWFQPWNQSVDWRNIYPGRVPLLGDYNTQNTMDKEIEAAAGYGVDFFQFLYYDNYPSEREPYARFLNRGVENFINSPKSNLMSFFIEWCNGPELYYILEGMGEFKKMIYDDWLPAFKHPSYLQIDGKLVFKVINCGDLLRNCNGSADCVVLYLDTLKQIVKEETGFDMLIGGGVGARWPVPSEVLCGYTYDWTGTYMDGPFDQYDPYKTYEWKIMSDWIADSRNVHVMDKIMYVPFVGVGWAPDPWREKRPSFEFPSSQEWQNDLKKVKEDLDNNANFGIPVGEGGRQKIFSSYAWNEFGEGGILAPSHGFQYDRLEGIQKVFGR